MERGTLSWMDSWIVLLQETSAESTWGAVGDVQEQKAPTDCRETWSGLGVICQLPKQHNSACLIMIDVNYMEIMTF